MRPLFLRYLRTLQEWEVLLEQEQVLSAPSALARWTCQVSSFLTWNNHVLVYLTRKSVRGVWSCSWGMCFQVMGAGGQDCLGCILLQNVAENHHLLTCNVVEVMSPFPFVSSVSRLSVVLIFLSRLWSRQRWRITYIFLYCEVDSGSKIVKEGCHSSA